MKFIDQVNEISDDIGIHVRKEIRMDKLIFAKWTVDSKNTLSMFCHSRSIFLLKKSIIIQIVWRSGFALIWIVIMYLDFYVIKWKL